MGCRTGLQNSSFSLGPSGCGGLLPCQHSAQDEGTRSAVGLMDRRVGTMVLYLGSERFNCSASLAWQSCYWRKCSHPISKTMWHSSLHTLTSRISLKVGTLMSMRLKVLSFIQSSILFAALYIAVKGNFM